MVPGDPAADTESSEHSDGVHLRPFPRDGHRAGGVPSFPMTQSAEVGGGGGSPYQRSISGGKILGSGFSFLQVRNGPVYVLSS
jgi:hypothetical protein